MQMMTNPGAAQQIMQSGLMVNEATRSNEVNSEKKQSAAKEKDVSEDMPSLEFVLPLGDSGRPITQPEAMPAFGLNLLPAGDLRMGPGFELQGVLAPVVSFLNPLQLQQGDAPVKVTLAPAGHTKVGR